MKRRCPHCHKTYELGINGIKGTCDSCAHIQRDNNGYAWQPWENCIKLNPLVTNETITITHQEAFSKNPKGI